MPSSASRGVREAPLPVVPGRDPMPVRLTWPSCLAGLPYSLMPAPGDFIHGGVSGGASASARATDAVPRPPAPSSATLRFKNVRRRRSMLPPLFAEREDPDDSALRDVGLGAQMGVDPGLHALRVDAPAGLHGDVF